MIGISGTFLINGGRGRATLQCVQSIHRIDSQLGRYLDINSAWRDPIEQEKLYNAYRRDPRNNPIALAPENSVHCKGEAIDSDDGYNSNIVRVLNNNGWFHTVYRIENGVRVLKEPWHFEYDYNRDNFRNSGTPSGTESEPYTPEPLKGLSDMRVIKHGPHYFTFGAQYVKHETSVEQAAYMAGVLNPEKNFIETRGPKDFDAICESFGVSAASVTRFLRSSRERPMTPSSA